MVTSIRKKAFTLLCLAICTYAQQQEGDSCKTKEGRDGVCKNIQQCQAAIEEVNKGNLPLICGFQDRTPIVCCPNSQTQTTPPPRPVIQASKSKQKCKEYSKLVYIKSGVTVLLPNAESPKESQCVDGGKTFIIGGTKAEPKEFPHMWCDKRESARYEECGGNRAVTIVLVGESERGFSDIGPECGLHVLADGCYQPLGKVLKAIRPAILWRDLKITLYYYANIGFGNKNTIKWACGGSLISEKFVVTAAHCLASRDWGKAKWVRLGDLNINRTDDGTKIQEFSIANMFRHPEYSSPGHYNDIALIQLDREAKFDDGYVRPACLHTEENLPAENPVATGWGLTDWIGSQGSDDLLKVQLSYQDPALCNDTFSPMIGGRKLRVGITPDTMLCVGDLNGGKDTCRGDSGGPLQVRMEDPKCMYDIIGITSFGSICGSPNAPAVYTRVSHFVPWIESIVWS